eukprot:scaffold631_cov49-Cyclotella_meneghiniana.AAC.5
MMDDDDRRDRRGGGMPSMFGGGMGFLELVFRFAITVERCLEERASCHGRDVRKIMSYLMILLMGSPWLVNLR